MKDIIGSYFSGEAVKHLGQAAGLDATATQRALSLGLPLQLDALAAHAAQPEGRTQIGEAISNLPRFGSVGEALASPNGAANLRQAGELLAPTLLGGQAEQMVQEVTRRVGGGAGGVQQVLQMSLPLLLSLLGRQGLNAVNADSMLGRLRGTLGDLNLAGLSAGAATVGGAALSGTELGGTELGASQSAASLNAAPLNAAPLNAADLSTPGGLLAALRAPFEGQGAEQVGRAAGLSGGQAGRMVLGALPVVLGALVNKGRSEAGAGELLNMSQPFGRLVGENGQLDAALLSDSAEMARIEGQGRGLLGGLFGNPDALTGRLGTALGGSGAGAGRLLALLTPLVLGVLGQRARATGTGPQALSGLLGGAGALLPGLIPAGMSGVAGLLGTAGTPATPSAATSAPVAATTVSAAIPEPVVTQAAPVTPPPVAPAPVTPAPAAATPRPVTPPPPPQVTTTVASTTERRRGFPWWLGLLPLLLIGGCLWNQNRTQTTTTTTATTTTDAGGIIVSNPESGSNLPPEAFTMSGTAAPDMNLVIEDEGQQVAQATADASGNWTAEIPAPTPGEHTYSIIGGETARSEFKVNVTDAAGDVGTDAAAGTTDPATGTDGAATGGTDTGTGTATEPATGGTDAAGTFAVNEPASGAEVAGTGFNLTGTGEAGQTYELLEDGVSVGSFTVGDDGTWSTDVAAPSAGEKTYTIRSEDGSEVASLPVTVAAATGDVAACTQDLSVSVADGESVTAPFRFGGVGSGEGYRVTVVRDGRTVGTRNIELGAGCTWSYNSNPGGRAGQVNDVTYEVRPIGTETSEPATTTLNLKVRQP